MWSILGAKSTGKCQPDQPSLYQKESDRFGCLIVIFGITLSKLRNFWPITPVLFGFFEKTSKKSRFAKTKICP